MNNLFFGVLCTLLGAAIGGIITISSPQTQKTLTNSLIAATAGIASAWVGYGLGRWQAKKEVDFSKNSLTSQGEKGSSNIVDTPTFRITYPHLEVKAKDDVAGSFVNLTEDNEHLVWLYICDDRSIYTPHKVRNIDRLNKVWRIENIHFGEANKSCDGKTYDMQVILASESANSELLSGEEQGLRQLPRDIQRISDKITVKRKVFF